MQDVVIVGAARTPMGGFQGAFSGVSAATLGGAAIAAALSGIDPGQVEEVLMGCVLPAGQGQAPARQAGFAAGLGAGVPATTLNKMCGSGMKAVMIAHDQIALGQTGLMVAGGMESMTERALSACQGCAAAHGSAMHRRSTTCSSTGWRTPIDKGRLMGTFAEDCAEAFQFTREAQDDYALASLTRALAAQASGALSGRDRPGHGSGPKAASADRRRRTARQGPPGKDPAR